MMVAMRLTGAMQKVSSVALNSSKRLNVRAYASSDRVPQPTKRLSEKEIDSYKRDGYLIVKVHKYNIMRLCYLAVPQVKSIK